MLKDSQEAATCSCSGSRETVCFTLEQTFSEDVFHLHKSDLCPVYRPSSLVNIPQTVVEGGDAANSSGIMSFSRRTSFPSLYFQMTSVG